MLNLNLIRTVGASNSRHFRLFFPNLHNNLIQHSSLVAVQSRKTSSDEKSKSQSSNKHFNVGQFFAVSTVSFVVLGTIAYLTRRTKDNDPPPPKAKATGSTALPVVEQTKTEPAPSSGRFGFFGKKKVEAPPPKVLPKLPEHVQYLIIGAGTASNSACRSIRAAEGESKILVIGDEDQKPYMRPPLSKELWFSEEPDVAKTLKFKQWNGKERGLHYEKDEFYVPVEQFDDMEHGGISVLQGWKVVKLNPAEHKAVLENGTKIKYDKCLIATGGKPKNLKIIKDANIAEHVTLFRNVADFQRLDAISRGGKSIAIIGGGFLGSELAVALANRAKSKGGKIIQVFPEAGNMGKVLPEYLCKWTTDKVRNEGVIVLPNQDIKSVEKVGDKIVLHNTADQLTASVDHVVVAVGLDSSTDLAESGGLEVDPEIGGYRVDAELRARSDVWVAGDCCSFYDIKLGRRRVEHHDHAVVTGTLAGENMTGAGKPYFHQSMFWSDLGPEVGYEAIGRIDSSLKTVAVFAKAGQEDTPKAAVTASGEGIRSEATGDKKSVSEAPGSIPHAPQRGEDYGKGVIFYLQGKKVVGVVLWNVFNRIPIARKILQDQQEYDDFNEVAKLFHLHGIPSKEEDDKKSD